VADVAVLGTLRSLRLNPFPFGCGGGALGSSGAICG
jgi:hypothetical protein